VTQRASSTVRLIAVHSAASGTTVVRSWMALRRRSGAA